MVWLHSYRCLLQSSPQPWFPGSGQCFHAQAIQRSVFVSASRRQVIQHFQATEPIDERGLPQTHPLEIPHGVVGVLLHRFLRVIAVSCNNPLNHLALEPQAL
jgi:hypothetical protein